MIIGPPSWVGALMTRLDGLVHSSGNFAAAPNFTGNPTLKLQVAGAFVAAPGASAEPDFSVQATGAFVTPFSATAIPTLSLSVAGDFVAAPVFTANGAPLEQAAGAFVASPSFAAAPTLSYSAAGAFAAAPAFAAVPILSYSASGAAVFGPSFFGVPTLSLSVSAAFAAAPGFAAAPSLTLSVAGAFSASPLFTALPGVGQAGSFTAGPSFTAAPTLSLSLAGAFAAAPVFAGAPTLADAVSGAFAAAPAFTGAPTLSLAGAGAFAAAPAFVGGPSLKLSAVGAFIAAFAGTGLATLNLAGAGVFAAAPAFVGGPTLKLLGAGAFVSAPGATAAPTLALSVAAAFLASPAFVGGPTLSLAGAGAFTAAPSFAGAPTVGSSFVGLLDKISETCTVALSTTRLLRALYTGAIMQVHSGFDAAEGDAYPDTDGWISTSSNIVITSVGSSAYTIGQTVNYATFLGGHIGLLMRRYDQSGSAHHDTDINNRPSVSDSSGNILAFGSNSRAGSLFDNNQIDSYQFAAPGTNFSFFMVTAADAVSFPNPNVFGSDGGGFEATGFYFQPNADEIDMNFNGPSFFNAAILSNSALADGNLVLLGVTHTSGNVATAYINASAGSPNTLGTWTVGSYGYFATGAYPAANSNSLIGPIMEQYAFSAVLGSTSLTALHSDVSTCFGTA